VAVSKIGVAVKEGQALPDIGMPAALRQALLKAASIGFSEGASGTYVSTVLLDKLGIAQEVQPKCHVVLGRKFVGAAVAEGEVEIGIQQISELLLESGITVVGPLPDEVQKLSVVSAAVSAKATSMDAAQQSVAFLSTPFATDAIRASGLDLPTA
jgi:molybdate transport system substrate-binding protein